MRLYGCDAAARVCDCTASPIGRRAACTLVTRQLQEIARNPPVEWQQSKWDGGGARAGGEFAWADALLDLEDDELDSLCVCIPADPPNVGHIPLSEGCESTVECRPLSERMGNLMHPHADRAVMCAAVEDVPWLTETPFPSHAFCCGVAHGTRGVCVPVALAQRWLVTPPPPFHPTAPPQPPSVPPPPPPADGATFSCSAIEIEVRVQTGDEPLPYGYSHVSWDIDGIVVPPASECAPALCAGGSEGDSHACGCLYGGDQLLVHRVCLTPGAHILTLHDMMGFGWFGANLTLRGADGTTTFLHEVASAADSEGAGEDGDDQASSHATVSIPTPSTVLAPV